MGPHAKMRTKEWNQVHDTFTILGIDFPAYFTFLMLGYTFVVLLAHKDTPRLKINGNHLLDMAMLLIIAGLIGARLLHVVADGQFDEYVKLCTDPLATKGELLAGGKQCVTDAQCIEAKLGALCHPEHGTCHSGRDCLRAFKFWYGGLAYYGGLALASVVGVLFIRWRKMPFRRVADLAGYGIPLGLVFGRLGCFFAGCCYGTIAKFGGLEFPKGSPAWVHHFEAGLITKQATHSLSVHVTQLWEAAASFAIFAYVYFWRRKRQRFDGQSFAWSLMAYAVARFIIEIWRDDPRGVWFGLSTSQWLGIPLFAIGAGLYWYWRKNPVDYDASDSKPNAALERNQEVDE